MEHVGYQALLAVPCLVLLWRVFQKNTTLANIQGPKGTNWWKGCFDGIFDANGWKFHHDIIEKYGSIVKLPMLFGREWLYVSDPLALYHVFIKEQDVYEEDATFLDTHSIVFGTSLLSTAGEHHRRQRKMLNPVFSMKHMRDLIPIFYSIAYELRDVLAEKVGEGTKEKEIDVMQYVSRAALDFIGQGGFGYSFNALHDAKSSKYGESLEQLAALLFNTSLLRQFLPWVINIGPPWFRRKVLECVPSKTIKKFIEVVDILDGGSREIYEQKKKALESGDLSNGETAGTGKDILSILMKANMAADEKDRLPEEEIIGQLNTFILAGQDTSSHALTRILHLLSVHPDVQALVRSEVIAARKERGGRDFDYDTLMNLPYLDAVVRETLRMYPPLIMVFRTTRKDTVMPLAYPILGADGLSEISEIPIKKNTSVLVSIIAANRNKNVWGEDAEEWKPERWLSPLPESVTKARMPGVYSSIMTFVGGSRACIGFKFAEMEIKLVLAVLLETFNLGAGPEVEWRMNGVVYPVLKHSTDESPQLPLKTSLISKA